MPRTSDDMNMLNMTGASNKAFDYMAAGLTLLVSDLPDWHAMFVAPGFGRACDPADPDLYSPPRSIGSSTIRRNAALWPCVLVPR